LGTTVLAGTAVTIGIPEDEEEGFVGVRSFAPLPEPVNWLEPEPPPRSAYPTNTATATKTTAPPMIHISLFVTCIIR
jgi:hypothetical protein